VPTRASWRSRPHRVPRTAGQGIEPGLLAALVEELADNAGEWVEWTVLCNAVGLTPRQASGMLGAAERRCKQLPPYEKAWEENQYWFRMPNEVAAVVKELAGKNE